ncbi:hypothetical protein ACFYXH_42120 [Streptomyces sp. NPDC002730]|uniref:hypothetical protein n=1 Tax=Streptomyces sp. NPDC002730 TaxID=3364662 RepID=UPI003674E77A
MIGLINKGQGGYPFDLKYATCTFPAPGQTYTSSGYYKDTGVTTDAYSNCAGGGGTSESRTTSVATTKSFAVAQGFEISSSQEGSIADVFKIGVNKLSNTTLTWTWATTNYKGTTQTFNFPANTRGFYKRQRHFGDIWGNTEMKYWTLEQSHRDRWLPTKTTQERHTIAMPDFQWVYVNLGC